LSPRVTTTAAARSIAVSVAVVCLAGCALLPAGTRATFALKSRTALPAASDFDPAVTLDALLQPGDDRQRFSPAKAAAIEGFVIAVFAANVEAVNGFLPHRRDVHIEVGRRPDAPRRERVIVEVTPALREWAKGRGWDWSSGALARDLLGRRCRFEGWLFFDQGHADEAENTHPGGRNNWRATAWELHPVTAIGIVP
jgi:hypothetical protein